MTSRSAGGIVIGEGGTLALVCHAHGSRATGFPKGHVEDGESDEDAARRELLEEAGIANLEYLDDLGTYERPAIQSGGTDDPAIVKSIHMYLFAAPKGAALKPTLEIGEAMWTPYREVAALMTHPKDRAWFAAVFDRVREAIQRD